MLISLTCDTHLSPRQLTHKCSLHYITPGPNSTVITTVYRKPTHTDQYLHWDNNHFITAKHSVYNTLAHRARVFSINQPSLLKELDHIRIALQPCYFPTWILNKLQHNFGCKHYNNNKSGSTDSQHNNKENNNGTSSNNNKNFPKWLHIYRDWVKHSKGHATRRVYKYILRFKYY